MDHRDDWPDEILEGELDTHEGLDDPAHRSVELIAREGRRMDDVLTAMASHLSESLSTAERKQTAPVRHRLSWRLRTMVPLAAAAVVASLILMRADRTGESESVAAPGTPPASSMTVEMNVEADRPFVVFPTSDPDMAVVWLLNPKESDG